MADAPAVGGVVAFCGFPPGTDVVMSLHGRVAGLARSSTNGQDVYHFDGVVNSGNSGGALIDGTGHIIGYVAAKLKGGNFQ
ncbi:MAG TPA: trypsin-like peptidase domain-containing protein [Chthonomonadales bacterium]|nr:trypsin-like peptidase domain-containing protein [Chthonomonadales bacterium]